MLSLLEMLLLHELTAEILVVLVEPLAQEDVLLGIQGNLVTVIRELFLNRWPVSLLIDLERIHGKFSVFNFLGHV